MSAYLQLTLAQLRLFSRNRQVLFWSLFFPIIFMIMLGSFFGNGNSNTTKIFLVDQDQTAASKSFVAELEATKAVKLIIGTETTKAMKDLKHGENELIVIIPQGYENSLTDSSVESAAYIQLYYDETNVTTQQMGQFLLNQTVDTISKKITNYKPVVTVKAEGVQTLNLKYIDFLVPGIVAMMIMSNNLNGVAGQIASWRERGILRQAIAKGNIQQGTIIGKLNGVIPPTTPIGKRYIPDSTFVAMSGSCLPIIKLGAPAANSTHSIPRSTSPCASW